MGTRSCQGYVNGPVGLHNKPAGGRSRPKTSRIGGFHDSLGALPKVWARRVPGTLLLGSLVAGHLGTKVNTNRLQRRFAHPVFAVGAFVVVDTAFIRQY